MEMNSNRRNQTISSAIWAAYGDSLGFQTELVDEGGVKRRTGNSKVTKTVTWSRLVGGKFGANVELPAGSYSDDTQLRLCTSRSITGDGYFDVEAFAKIELPIWLNYALGAGRGSKVGADALSRRGTAWFANFFDQAGTRYVDGGGNGAAMRIQPHVWAAKNLDDHQEYLTSIVKNALCTHGHPRGIAGAVLHAVALAGILSTNRSYEPNEWASLSDFSEMVPQIIANDSELQAFWLPTWQNTVGKSFEAEMRRVSNEWKADVATCLPLLNLRPIQAYTQVLTTLGGLGAKQRGSGIKCALFAMVAAWLFQDSHPDDALLVVANSLGSDTDTIGTMAGALIGALKPETLLTGSLQDQKYIEAEAARIFAVSQERKTTSFMYPDLLTWQTPKSLLDVVGTVDEAIAISGISFVEISSESFPGGTAGSIWQWLDTSFGQRMLCKRRIELKPLAQNSLPATDDGLPLEHLPRPKTRSPTAANVTSEMGELFPSTVAQSREAIGMRDLDTRRQGQATIGSHSVGNAPRQNMKLRLDAGATPSVNDLTDEAIRSNFEPAVIGKHLLKFAEQPSGIELAIAYSAIILKARQARLNRDRKVE